MLLTIKPRALVSLKDIPLFTEDKDSLNLKPFKDRKSTPTNCHIKATSLYSAKVTKIKFLCSVRVLVNGRSKSKAYLGKNRHITYYLPRHIGFVRANVLVMDAAFPFTIHRQTLCWLFWFCGFELKVSVWLTPAVFSHQDVKMPDLVLLSFGTPVSFMEFKRLYRKHQILFRLHHEMWALDRRDFIRGTHLL